MTAPVQATNKTSKRRLFPDGVRFRLPVSCLQKLLYISIVAFHRITSHS
jgi:hypothetical protein